MLSEILSETLPLPGGGEKMKKHKHFVRIADTGLTSRPGLRIIC